MIRARGRLLAGLAILGLLSGVLFAAPASGSTRAATQGVTDDEITVVGMVADLDGLRSKGLIAQPKLTTGNLMKRWQAYIDAFGPINGRKIVLETVVWDPIDATTYDKACVQATQKRTSSRSSS